MAYTRIVRAMSATTSIEEAVAQSISIAGALRLLGRAPVGSNYAWMHKQLAALGLPTEHWRGQAHGTTTQVAKRPLEEWLVVDGTVARSSLKARLLREGLLPYHCATCGISEWQDRPLVLRLDHKNGVRNDDRLENLQLVCPNCDSQSETYCGRNLRGRAKTARCADCAGDIHRNSTWCRPCAQNRKKQQPTKIQWPPVVQLLEMLRRSNFSTIARELGVSDNAIRKRLRASGAMPERSKGEPSKSSSGNTHRGFESR